MSETIDIDHLKGWIGRSEEAVDTIDPRLVKSFRATLDLAPGEALEGKDAPLCIHWCLAPPIVANAATGPDGHPARGGFLPPVPLPRRMWAGGQIAFRAPLKIGDTVRRVSTIEKVEMKTGRSGRLLFVSVRHAFDTARGFCVEERQDIVYRDMPPADAPTAPPPLVPDLPAAAIARDFEPSELALFRYSALTFNGHRIHYDRRYCINEEGYPGLVVHGPLQATLLAHLAAEAIGSAPSEFSYRGVNPLFDDDGLRLEARADEDRGWSLRAVNRAGATTMEAKART